MYAPFMVCIYVVYFYFADFADGNGPTTSRGLPMFTWYSEYEMGKTVTSRMEAKYLFCDNQ